MRVSTYGLAAWAILVLAGCNCEPKGGPDASTPLTLEWPANARLEITATTTSSADLKWPDALGPLATYRLTVATIAQDQAGTTASLTGLTSGRHLHVDVVAVATDGTTTPPLRAEVAPSTALEVPDGDISTDFCGANAFLSQGSAAIPCDVFSVLVGHAYTTDGVGVPGMRISVIDHPEWGTAISQTDGLYALAVAAGRHTLELRASAFIPIQRLVTAKARDFSYLPDTAVLRRDEKATAISTAAGGFHTATPQEDEDGQRTTSVFIPPGTSAWLRLADGGTQTTGTLTLRATEATVGPSGPRAMPASLPGATAYTFAADLSADEAVAAGARGVGFATPVAIYADNFLHYPVGGAIPLGIYDETTARWESGPNAAVLQVTAGGVDYTGDGVADADFPLLQGEAETLAAHYAPGAQLVRSVTRHFSAMDTNSCWRCIGSCTEAGEAQSANNETCPTCMGGSLVRVQNRTLSEFISVAGTGLSLAWHSNRFNVRKAAVDMKLGLLADGGAPQGVVATYFRLEVAGRRYEVEHADAGMGDAVQLSWDGKDAFGRAVRGPVAATSTTAYGFRGVSVMGTSGTGATGVVEYSQESFGVWPAPGAVQLSSTREAAFYLKHTSHSLGDWVPRENLSNLSLDILHGYSEDGTLHLGSGGQVSAAESGAMVRHVGGGGTDFSEDAGHFTVGLGAGTAVLAEGPQGIFFLEKEARVRLLKPDGGVSTVAGDINVGFAGDGLPATQGRFNYARLLETDPAGNLYVGDIENYRIRKVDSVTGFLSTVVGNGQRGFSPDGTPATDAKLDGLSDILFGHDGHLYFIAADNAFGSTLRRVENGRLTTVAGGSPANFPPWEAESPKGIAFRNGPHWLAQGLDGTLFVAGYDSGNANSDFVVRRIEADGRVRLVAGAGTSPDADESEALKTCFSGITGLAVAHDGTLYVGESGGTGCGRRGPGVRRITPDGAFSLFFGGVTASTSGYLPPNGSAAQTQLNGVGDLILRSNGRLLMVHKGPTATLHEVAVPTVDASRLVPSRDGEEVYGFDARGRHLRTVSARTGLLLWTFAWGPQGLVSVTDIDGDVTRVERRADGSAQALVAQDGQRTELQLNPVTGLVERVTDTMGRFVEAAYFPNGLLSEWKDENGNATAFTWDDTGNLATHTNARGAKRDFAAVVGGVGFTSPEGRLTQYLTASRGGQRALTTANPDGTVSTRVYGAGVERHFSADGTSMSMLMQPGAADRFGRAGDVPGTVVVRTPSGLESTATSVRTSTQAAGDVLAVTEEVEETRVNGRLWRSRYDALTRTYEWTSPAGRTASTMVDEKQRPLVVTAPGVLSTAYTYDARGRLDSVVQGPREQHFTYGPTGFLASTRNSLNESTAWTTDATGRVLKTTRADSREIAIEQDNVGNLESVTPPDGEAHRYGYSKTNEAVSYSQPSSPGVVAETASFDRDGLGVSGTHFDSSSTTLTREPSGRLTQVATPWWTSQLTYTPTTGQVQSLTRGGQRLEWSYDGFLVTEERATGIAPALSTWSYDTDFRVTAHAVSGAPVAYGYDADSLLTRVGAATLSRDALSGRLTSVSVGAVTTSFLYNPHGELSLMASTVNGTPLFSEGLSYDLAGRITVLEDTVEGVPTQWTYGYDRLGQLVSALRNGVPTSSWGYDARGNRTSEGAVITTYDRLDRIQTRGAVSYGWDALGGRVTRTEAGGVTRYLHDGMGALLSVELPDATAITYEYDGRQRRVGKRRGAAIVARFVYDSQARVAAEVDANGDVLARFVYSSQSNSADYLVRGGATYVYVKNHLGSVRFVVNAASGAIAQRLDYDAWGVITANTAPGFQPFAAAGGIFDADTGFTHFGFRDYEAVSGLWTAMDPIRLGAGHLAPDPLMQRPNYLLSAASQGELTPTYAYAANNPLRNTDPTGLFVLAPGSACGNWPASVALAKEWAGCKGLTATTPLNSCQKEVQARAGCDICQFLAISGGPTMYVRPLISRAHTNVGSFYPATIDHPEPDSSAVDSALCSGSGNVDTLAWVLIDEATHWCSSVTGSKVPDCYSMKDPVGAGTGVACYCKSMGGK